MDFTLTARTYVVKNIIETRKYARQRCTVKNVTRACYLDDEHLIDGAMSIAPPVRSAKIRSKIPFRYGRIEIKAKLPVGDWLVPHLVLEPSDYNENPDREPTEIFIAYARGNKHLKRGNNKEELGHQQLYAGVNVDQEDRTKNMRKLLKKNWNRDFHIFQIEWTSKGLSFWVDEEKIEENKPLPESALSRFNNTYFHLNIGLSAGGIPDFPDVKCTGCEDMLISDGHNKPWNNTDPWRAVGFLSNRKTWLSTWSEDSTLQIDYIKVYAI